MKFFNDNSDFFLELARNSDELIDLANVGLASDVMTHEFAQYIELIREALDAIREFELDDYGDHWVRVLTSGVTAVSANLIALEPMNKSQHSQLAPSDLGKVMNDIATLFDARSQKNDIEMVLDIEEGTVVTTSLSRLFPSVCNLLDNMFYWVMLDVEGKTIGIKYDGTGILFTNSGPDIRPETADLLFTPFFSTKDGGRGLGLYLSRESLRTMDWDLVLLKKSDPSWLGGPVFKIRIPKIHRMK